MGEVRKERIGDGGSDVFSWPGLQYHNSKILPALKHYLVERPWAPRGRGLTPEIIKKVEQL